MNNKDLKKLKKLYGEDFAKLCRVLFPTLLETEGLLTELITSKFAPSHSLYESIVSTGNIEYFKGYIYSFVDVEKRPNKEKKTVKEILDEKGYDLFECYTEEDIQSFRKYYAEGEELCTFRGDRLSSCIVFWVVKKDVDKIKREDFPIPERQDEYGTSVMSIQFTRKGHTLSIKNRYNHRVNNPDATFSNNLDNIAPGLTEAFEREYNLRINQGEREFNIPGYVTASDGRNYKYNYCIYNIYYCENNIIIDNGRVVDLNKLQLNRYILIDYFIFDKQERKIYPYDKGLYDSFLNGVQNLNKESKDNKVQKAKVEESLDKETGIRTIKIKPVDEREEIIIKVDKYGRIVGYNNPNITHINYGFLQYNQVLKSIQLPNVKTIDSFFLEKCEELEEIDFPKLEKVNTKFLSNMKKTQRINLPNLKTVGDEFLYCCEGVEEIDFPKLEKVGELFMNHSLEVNVNWDFTINEEQPLRNPKLKKINLPSLKEIPYYLKWNIEEYQKRIKPPTPPKKSIKNLKIFKTIKDKIKLIKKNLTLKFKEEEHKHR